MADIHVATEAVHGPSLWHEAIPLAPHLFWAIILLSVVLWLGPGNFANLLRRVRKVGFAGVEIELGEEIMHAARAREHPISSRTATRLSRRLASSDHILEGARILWVDDEPLNNIREVEILERLRANVIHATSTDEALVELRRLRFDVIISDMRRGSEPRAGLTLLEAVLGQPSHPGMIFYVRAVQKPVPAGAFGITNRPDELFDLVLDVLARRRF